MSSTGTDVTSASLRELTEHIVSTHHEFLKLNLPKLRNQLDEVRMAHADGPHPKLDRIEATFQTLYDDLAMHLRKEEMILFPAIVATEESSQSGVPTPAFPFGSVANPIAMMEREHEQVDGALNQLREITNNYQAGCGTCKELMAALRELDEDLRVHIHLENDILHPRVLALEAQATTRS